MTQKKPMNFWEKLGNIDYRWLYALSIIFTIIPIVHPLGMAIQVSEPTKGFADVITNLKEGSVVAVSFGASAQLLDEQEAQFLATWKTLFQHKLKVIFYSTQPDGPILLKDELGKKVTPESYGYKYGTDYVNLGYSPLGEAGEASIAQNIRGVFPNDMYGTPLNQIPLMQNINDQSKIDLIIFEYTSCTDVEFPIRQWVVPYKKPCIVMTLGCCGPMAAPYYPAQIQGFLSGSGMGTEMEVYTNNPGPGALMSDAKNLGILPFLFFFVLGNLSYLGKRFKLGESKETPPPAKQEVKS
jgi:hypothetical protein